EPAAQALVTICQRLDGIPLAIELAAARVKSGSLSLPELASGLDRRFELLTRGSPTAPARHQRLERALDWSYDLLSAEEQAVFRRLAVFVGGWTAEAAEAVTDAPAALLLDLVDKSLVEASAPVAAAGGHPPAGGEGTHYRFLEMVRHYAREK